MLDKTKIISPQNLQNRGRYYLLRMRILFSKTIIFLKYFGKDSSVYIFSRFPFEKILIMYVHGGKTWGYFDFQKN